MKLIVALILLAAAAFGTALVAFGVALSRAGSSGAMPLYLLGSAALAVAVLAVIGARADNRRNRTSHTLFTI